MADDPFRRFAAWYHEVQAAAAPADVVALATATPDGRPSLRFVVLRGFDPAGFVFYTDSGSRKSRELDANPQAALAFYWDSLHRQVRVEGRVSRVGAAEAAAYFASRARGSQIGAWASAQSEVIAGRAVLEQAVAAAERRFAGRPVPPPPTWCGYRLAPEVFEFWEGRADRLHERIRYRRGAVGDWIRERLAP